MSDRPTVLVTRKLPDAVEDRLRRDYDPRFNPEDRRYSDDELVERAQDADAIVPCHTENLSAAVIARLPERLRAIVNFSVGVDHVDLAAAKARGIAVTNTPEVLSDATAEIAALDARRRQARQRRRAAAAFGRLEFLVAGVHGRHRGYRQAPRHRRHGPRRPASPRGARAAST